MGDGVDGFGPLFGEDASLESVTGVAGPVLLAATVPDLSRGDVLAGRYQIEAVIGSGGSGRVLRAFDRVTRSPVALKILRSEFAADPVWTERFSRELRVGRQIQHANVCRVYDIGEADGHRFLSMELATGGTLRTQLEPGSMPRSVDDRIADARAIIQGVAALHAAGIVHRDLKPENILRTADGRLLVSDFGLATDPGSGPATTVMIGTPRYMAPEVVMGDPATTRSDVWALGVVMHEILSGERPDRSLIKRKRRIYTPPEVGSIRERRLVELCARCSEEDPEGRPASAVDLRREFEAAAAGRRFGNRALKKQVAWGAVALATIASLGLIRNQWTSNAIASSSQVAGAQSAEVLQPRGPIADWGGTTRQVASFAGGIHCFSVVDSGRRLRVIWGTPRKAEEIRIAGGTREKADLQPETFATGCPEESPDGKHLLFGRTDDTGSRIYVSSSRNGVGAKELVRGESPLWLPNSEEFLFGLDGRHAALFSIPTGQMTVVGDQLPGARHLTGIAIAADGHHVALRYLSGTARSLVMVHSLPNLELNHSLVAPFSTTKLQFSPSGQDVLFATEGEGGSTRVVALDWQRGLVRNVGGVPGMDVRGVVQGPDASHVVARKLTRDIWLQSLDGTVRLTSDGDSDNGSLALSGDMLIQRHLADGSYKIVVRNHDGVEKTASAGPLDTTPSFLPNGREWLYASVNTHEVKRCKGPNQDCQVVLSDALTPLWPVADPAGKRFAYMTVMNQARLHRANLDGEPTPVDLGACSADCAPVWTSNDRVWILNGVQDTVATWAEVDVNRGARTGRIEAVLLAPDATLKCKVPEVVLARTPSATHVTYGESEQSTILRADRALF